MGVRSALPPLSGLLRQPFLHGSGLRQNVERRLQTLLAHHDAWVTEPSPSKAVLTRLTEVEAVLYQALGDDSYGPSVRLKQELIRGDWAQERLPSTG